MEFGGPLIEDPTSPMAVVQRYHTSPSPKMSSEGNVSKLSLMQARFQQRQQQEKEQKLLQLYSEQAQQAYARIGVGPAGGSGGGGGGKVRQLLQERRVGGSTTKQGLDRSYPLQPLESRRAASLDRSQLQRTKKPAANFYKGTPPRYPSAGYEGDDDYFYQPQNNNILYTSQQRIDQDFIDYNQKSNGYKQKQVFNDENDFLPRSYDLESTKIFKKLPNIGGALLTEQKAMMAPAKEPELKKPTPLAARAKPTADPAVKSVTKAMSKLSTTRKSEVKVTPAHNAQSRVAAAATPSSNNTETKTRIGLRRPTPVPANNSIRSRPPSAANNFAQEPVKTRVEPKSTLIKPAVRPTASKTSAGGLSGSPSRSDLVGCDNCGRNFAPDRIDAHRNICLKTSKKKRKPFDPTKQRLKGTGAETYLRKGKTATLPQITAKKNNWRKKHEEFINNIRAAKVAQAHIAAGGKISDLPPPPPSDTSDYVQCPHCSRKFNEGAASRHIPKCANMLHNKPKPAQGQSRTQAARKRY